MPNRHRKRTLRRERREGAALLIVLFIVMMATGTAMFSLQGTQFEQRAAGSVHQATRTRYVAEAATTGVLAYCYELGPVGCADLKRANESAPESVTLRKRYGLPDYVAGTGEQTYQLGPSDLVGASFPGGADAGVSSLVPPDERLVGAPPGTSGVAAAFTPSFVSVMEKWQVPNPGETRPRYRLIVSTYGHVNVAGSTVKDASEERSAHESISATRAFFDVR